MNVILDFDDTSFLGAGPGVEATYEPLDEILTKLAAVTSDREHFIRVASWLYFGSVNMGMGMRFRNLVGLPEKFSNKDLDLALGRQWDLVHSFSD